MSCACAALLLIRRQVPKEIPFCLTCLAVHIMKSTLIELIMVRPATDKYLTGWMAMFQPTVTSKRPVSGGSSIQVDGECGAKLGLVLLDAAKTSVKIKDTRFSERVITTSFEEKIRSSQEDQRNPHQDALRLCLSNQFQSLVPFQSEPRSIIHESGPIPLAVAVDK